jgi:hypothetical protein
MIRTNRRYKRYMKIRNNYKKSEFTYNSGNLNLDCIFREDSKKASDLEITIVPDALTYKLSNDPPVKILVKFGDIHRSIEQLLEVLNGRGLSLKSCGQCIYFGYSAMSFDMSGGTAGYCTLINGTNVSSAKGDVVGIFNLCDAFVFRKERTETSPWLPS